jgi:hypothetical protein
VKGNSYCPTGACLLLKVKMRFYVLNKLITSAHSPLAISGTVLYGTPPNLGESSSIRGFCLFIKAR